MPPHQLLGFARAVDAALDRVAETPAWSMSAEEQRETLRVLHRVEARMEELGLRVLAAADNNQVGTDAGATSTAAWLAHETRTTRQACFARTRLAADLDERFGATRAALAAGRIDAKQAAVVVAAVDRLTDEHDDLPEGVWEAAEEHLLDLAAAYDATTLKQLGKHVYEVVCPGAADHAEGDRLAKEEAAARRSAFCSLRENGDGSIEGRFKLPLLHGQLLKKALEALSSPRRLGEGRLDPVTGKKLRYSTLLGHGLMDLLENHLNLDSLPGQGGCPFTVVVTVGLDALRADLGAASLDTGGRLSPGEVRRLCCRAGIIPMVLDGASMPLDLGREQRLHSRYQRLAYAKIHGGCAAGDCDRPPAWVEIHHQNPWREGGRTDLANGLPLCPPHHHMADHPESWTMHRMPHGGVRFARRQ